MKFYKTLAVAGAMAIAAISPADAETDFKLAEEKTLRMMTDREVWLSSQVVIYTKPQLFDIDVVTRPSETLHLIMKAGRICKTTVLRGI